MISIEENISLAPFSAMRSGGAARYFVRAKNEDDIREVVAWADENDIPFFVLGGGSNTLVLDDGYHGLVIKVELKEVSCKEDGGRVCVTAESGVLWDDLVRDSVERGWWGIENLSLIPGTVGGATVQNIGAYGAEASECIAWVEAFDTLTKKKITLSRDECAYGYRESVFKKKQNLIVLRTAFNLSLHANPRLGYEDVERYFGERGIASPALRDIREAIVAIRTTKLPSQELGSLGSFFKNPVVTESSFAEIIKKAPEVKAYPQKDGTVKLSAGWLFDRVGNWRGVRRGDAGVYEKQALILVNYGTARTKDILDLAQAMKNDIHDRVGVVIEEEVVVLKN